MDNGIPSGSYVQFQDRRTIIKEVRVISGIPLGA